MINYALATKAADVILPQLKKLRLRLQEWGATKDQIRQIYSTVRKVHQEVGNTPKAHKTALRILATYEGESAEALAKVAADAASVIVEAIKLPESFQFDHILELAAVKELASSADHGKLHRLLSIFTTENLAAYDKFVAENAGFIEAQGTYRMRGFFSPHVEQQLTPLQSRPFARRLPQEDAAAHACLAGF